MFSRRNKKNINILILNKASYLENAYGMSQPNDYLIKIVGIHTLIAIKLDTKLVWF